MYIALGRPLYDREISKTPLYYLAAWEIGDPSWTARGRTEGGEEPIGEPGAVPVSHLEQPHYRRRTFKLLPGHWAQVQFIFGR
jgi:hypothetical protein